MLSFNIILLCLVLLVLVGLTYHLPFVDGFADSGSHMKFVEESNRKLNSLTNTINLTNPALPIDPITTDLIHQATNVVLADPNSTTYSLSAKAPYSPPDQTPGVFQRAASCSEAPKTCDAFDDPTFAQNCGMSFDLNGVGYDGRPFTGGLYVSTDDREQQTAKAKTVRDTGSAPYDPHQVYQPTLGKAKAGTFGLTKGQCIVVKEKLDCATKQTFNTPNCTQCYTSQSFSRVGPETGRLPSTLNLFGVGSISISSSNGTITLAQTSLSKDTAIAITIPPNAEGTTFTINVSGAPPFYLSGFIEGPTARGTFKLELMTIIQKDIITNAKPRISGTVRVGGFRCFTLMPGNGKTSMNLSCLVPFSFINMFDGDALACDNGPIITNEASATFLESDPCFGKANSPGNYKLECLQSRWMELGGTMQGTGFPKDQASADAIQKDASGRPLSIDDIVDILAIKSAQAQTGTDATGKSLLIPDWNTVSMYMTGVPINTPCDGPNNAVGPLSRDCLSYLYTNKGVSSRIGNTYTQNPGRVASSKEGFIGDALVGDALVGDALDKDDYLEEQFENPPNTFNYPNTSIDPATAAGKEFGQMLGGVEAVKKKYDDINRLANDNSKTNTDRRTAIMQAYGVQLGNPSSNKTIGDPQVFAVGPGYQYTRAEAPSVCAAYGAEVATTKQLEEAQRNGADWCFSGWVTEGSGKWPITMNPIPGCGSRTGIIEWTPGDKAGVNCYGPKPDIADPAAAGKVLPFNQQMWLQPTDPTYLTIPSGYLQTTGPQPSCFSGLSVEAAQKGCNSLGSQCAGFSYSKDGTGNGCYKGNHNAGIVADPAYMGYIKVPVSSANAVITGRYIKIQYNRHECLNLAEIRVYSTNGGPNIINRNTPVTKSSGYQGDMFPGRNFVDGDTGQTYNFVHTSCGDIPWVQVDLGSMINIFKVVVFNRVDCCQSRILGAKLQIMNSENEMVYASNEVNSTNRTYAWFPPSPDIRVDLPEDLPPTPMSFSLPSGRGDYYKEWNMGTINQTGTTSAINITLNGNDQGWGNPTPFKISIHNSAGAEKWAWQANFPRSGGTISNANLVSPDVNVVNGDTIKIAALTWGWGHTFVLRGGSMTITLK